MEIIPGRHDDVRESFAISFQQKAEAEYGLVPDQVGAVFWGLVAFGLVAVSTIAGGWFYGIEGVIGAAVLGCAFTLVSITAWSFVVSVFGGVLSRVAAACAGATAGAMFFAREKPLDPWEPYVAIGLGIVVATVTSIGYREHLAREYAVRRWRVTTLGLLVRTGYVSIASAVIGSALANL